MKRMIAVSLIVFVLSAGCKKSSSNSSITVEYQVTTTNSSNIDISYNNVLGNKTQVNTQTSWVFDIIGPTKPYSAYIQASSSSPFSSIQTTCTVTILVNGGIVKTATASSNTIAVAEADYTVQ
ncbi:MAG TPA: hypothetical protein VKI61_13485 [Chitinophagaceae bacterium]|jgi:hypothetical protein|nr:hypothetical protein [Chitinophagaceae bacterium]